MWSADVVQRKSPVGLYFNYLYVGIWATLAVGVYIAIGYVDADSALAWLLAAIVIWRFLEVTVWYLKLLLDRTHRYLFAPERNLLFLIADTFIGVTLTATLLAMAEGSSTLVPTWVDGLSVITLNGRPEGYSGGWADGATLVGTLLGLALLGAGLALLVGLVEEKFRPGPPRYTGPTGITRPRRLPTKLD